jgi:hypothetical protein
MEKATMACARWNRLTNRPMGVDRAYFRFRTPFVALPDAWFVRVFLDDIFEPVRLPQLPERIKFAAM